MRPDERGCVCTYVWRLTGVFGIIGFSSAWKPKEDTPSTTKSNLLASDSVGSTGVRTGLLPRERARLTDGPAPCFGSVPFRRTEGGGILLRSESLKPVDSRGRNFCLMPEAAISNTSGLGLMSSNMLSVGNGGGVTLLLDMDDKDELDNEKSGIGARVERDRDRPDLCPADLDIECSRRFGRFENPTWFGIDARALRACTKAAPNGSPILSSWISPRDTVFFCANPLRSGFFGLSGLELDSFGILDRCGFQALQS